MAKLIRMESISDAKAQHASLRLSRWQLVMSSARYAPSRPNSAPDAPTVTDCGVKSADTTIENTPPVK